MFLCRSLLVANDFWTDLNQVAGAGVKLDMDIARGIARENGWPFASSSNRKPVDFVAGHAHPAQKIRHPRDVRRARDFHWRARQCRLCHESIVFAAGEQWQEMSMANEEERPLLRRGQRLAPAGAFLAKPLLPRAGLVRPFFLLDAPQRRLCGQRKVS